MRESTDQKPAARSKGSKLLNLLPKATSFSVPNPPYSPGRDKGGGHHHRGFSGPIFSIVPAEARRVPSGGGGYRTPEPTSPKVSCIGQIKHSKKKTKKKAAIAKAPRVPPAPAPEKRNKPPRFAIGRLFGGGGGRPEKPPAPTARTTAAAAAAAAPAPALGQLRRFASGRDALANFDWRASRVADESAGGEEHSTYFYEEGSYDDDDDDAFIPHSAPILLGSGGAAPAAGGGGGGHVSTLEPKKEVNLWKRRTMAPPRPLHLE